MPIWKAGNQIPLSQVDAVAEAVYSSKHHIFGAGAGKVTLTPAETAGKYRAVIFCPDTFRKRALRQCYKNFIRMAAKQQLDSVAMPLLLPEKDRNFRKEALHLALSALGEALDKDPMEVHLVVPDSAAMQMPLPLTEYLTRNYWPEPVKACEPVERKRDICGGELFAPSMAPSMADFAPKKSKFSLKQFVDQRDAGFSETLLRLIDERGKKDSEVYNKANVSRQHFSKIRNNPSYKPTKATAIAFAIALELDMEQTGDLIGRAGYVLTRSSIFDLIIMYFIENKNYDLFEINEALFEYDQSILGG